MWADWFVFVKATLRSHGWRAETRIRDAIIANLPEDVLVHLGEALLNLETLSLARLEDDVCAAHRCPEAQSRLDIFLDSLSPGTMEPATALKTIRDFCGGANAREETLFTFLKRVLHPVVRQQMAAFSGEPIDVFCRRAQHLHLAHVTTATALPAVQNPTPRPTTDEMPTPYTAAALPDVRRHASGYPSQRDGPVNRAYIAPEARRASSDRAGRHPEDFDLCPQHQRFGRRAQRCDPPCAWRRLYGRRETETSSRALAPSQRRQLTQRGREHFRRAPNGDHSRPQRNEGRDFRDYQSPERDPYDEESSYKEQGNF